MSLTPSLNSPTNDLDLDPLLRNLARALEMEPTVNVADDATEAGSPNSQALAADILEQVRFGSLTPTQELEPGTVLGSYRLLEVLGVGGMSTVYRAEHIAMRRRVALKVLLFSLASNRQFVDRFYREAQAAARLDHPNVVKVHDINSQGNIHYLVMEFVDGRTVREVVSVGGPLDPLQAVQYMLQTVSALAHAHKQGIVHRDIKPENLVLENTGRIKLLDLGLARLNEIEDRLLTVYDTMLGTVDYIAPEQAENSHNVDARADIYSLGCTLYFMLAGHPPFDTGTAAQRLMFHLLKQPTRMTTLRSDIPPQLQAILDKSMAKAPAERYQTAEELAAALEACVELLGGAPSKPTAKPARPVSPPSRPEKPPVAPAAENPKSGWTKPASSAPPSKSSISALKVDVQALSARLMTPPTKSTTKRPDPAQVEAARREVERAEAAQRDAANRAALSNPAETVLWAPPPQPQPQPQPGGTAETTRPESNKPLPEIRVTVRRLLELWAGLLPPEYVEAVRDKIRKHEQVADIYHRIECLAGNAGVDAPEIEDAKMDPNDVAAYLDNAPAEKGVRTKYEMRALASDLYLAETAECLGIITQPVEPIAQPRQFLSSKLSDRVYGMADRVGSIEQKVGRLLVGLNDKDTFVRELAAEALGRIGPEAAVAADKLENSSNDPDRKVREVVRDALRKIRGNPEKSLARNPSAPKGPSNT